MSANEAANETTSINDEQCPPTYSHFSDVKASQILSTPREPGINIYDFAIKNTDNCNVKDPDVSNYVMNYAILRSMMNLFSGMDGYSVKKMTDDNGIERKVFVKWLGKCDCGEDAFLCPILEGSDNACKCNDKFDECTEEGCGRYMNFSIRPYHTNLGYSN
jgi:hypothetical protein